MQKALSSTNYARQQGKGSIERQMWPTCIILTDPARNAVITRCGPFNFAEEIAVPSMEHRSSSQAERPKLRGWLQALDVALALVLVQQLKLMR